MQQLQSRLKDYSTNLMTDPSAGLDPMRIASQDAINRRYNAMPGQVSRMMATRGYGSSGSFGNTMYQTQMGRSGEMSDLESRISQMILAQKNTGANLSQQLLQMTRGSTSTGTSPSTSLSDGFMSAGNGLNNIATMLTLSKLLKGPGPVGGYPGGSSDIPGGVPGGIPVPGYPSGGWNPGPAPSVPSYPNNEWNYGG